MNPSQSLSALSSEKISRDVSEQMLVMLQTEVSKEKTRREKERQAKSPPPTFMECLIFLQMFGILLILGGFLTQRLLGNGAVFFIAVGVIAALALVCGVIWGLKQYKIRQRLAQAWTVGEKQEHRQAIQKVIKEMIVKDLAPTVMSAVEDVSAIHDHLQTGPEWWQVNHEDLAQAFGETVLAGHLAYEIDIYLKTRSKKFSSAQKVLNDQLKTERERLAHKAIQMAEQISLLRGEILRLKAEQITSSNIPEKLDYMLETAKSYGEDLKALNMQATKDLTVVQLSA